MKKFINFANVNPILNNMSNQNSSASFILGGIIGAAVVYLTCTDKGKALLKEGLDFIDSKLSDCLEPEPEDKPEEMTGENGIVTEE